MVGLRGMRQLAAGAVLGMALASAAAAQDSVASFYRGRTVTVVVGSSPGVPQERVEALRKAFMDTMTDPDLVSEARRINLDIAPIPGEDLQKLIAKLYATAPEIVEKAKAALVYKP